MRPFRSAFSEASLRLTALAVACTGLFPAPAPSGEIPHALVVLEALTETVPGHVVESAPPRFVLLEEGQLFVGGTSEVAEGRLDPREQKALDKRVSEIRRLPGLAGRVTLGSGNGRHRLLLRKGRPIDMLITGDPTQATGALRPLGSLLYDLARFDHPSLRPFKPSLYALSAREGRLTGGCRFWPFSHPPSASAFVPRVMPAAEVGGWPVGAVPASVCHGGKTYVVTLRPLLPGETP